MTSNQVSAYLQVHNNNDNSQVYVAITYIGTTIEKKINFLYIPGISAIYVQCHTLLHVIAWCQKIKEEEKNSIFLEKHTKN